MYFLCLKIFSTTFSFLQFIIKIQYTIHITHKICVHQQFVLFVKASSQQQAISSLTVAKLWGSQKLCMDFPHTAPLTSRCSRAKSRWKRITISINGAGANGYLYSKRTDFELYLTPYTQINST